MIAEDTRQRIKDRTTEDRFEKGVLLFTNRRKDFQRTTFGYYIPSSDVAKPEEKYAVRIDHPNEERCLCPDFEYRASAKNLICKHIVAALLADAEMRDHLLVDAAYCRILADELGTIAGEVESVFLGEPKALACEMVEWADAQEDKFKREHGWRKTVREFNHMRLLKSWARKHGRGLYRSREA